MTATKRHLITAALPYANGPVHIGHLAGVYIPADIYARYLRLKHEDIVFVCGSDEHGVPITLAARKSGISPQDIVDKYHELNKKSFENFGISFDIFHRTTNKTHYKTASEFFRKLYDKGAFIEKSSEQYFDEEAGQFLADRYITGTCPHCSYDSAYGDQCENCGTSLSPTDLINPRSAISGSQPVMKETKHWYLPLDRYEPFLKQWILEKNKHWKPNVYGQCKSWIDGGLEARAVTRDLDWGIPVPVPGAEGKVLYVWFDAPIGYISATRDLRDDWEKYWKDPGTRMIHFIGKDNIVFHCIIFPAMLKTEGSYILPANVPANEFLNLEGDKISTSRNWAVWLHEYLEDFPGKQDVLRYVLCANAPETKDNDFTWRDFQARNNNELVAILGNFVNRALVLTHNYFDGVVPPLRDPGREELAVAEELRSCRQGVESALDNFRFREALREAMNLARTGNKYLADREPWKLIKTGPDQVGNILNVSLQITANLSLLIEPFLPDTAMKLQRIMGTGNAGWQDIGKEHLVEAGQKIAGAELLFEKIDDEAIERQLKKLENNKMETKNTGRDPKPLKEQVSYEQFDRMDLRVARVLHAERVPKTDKLLKLELETGLDKRTVVAGIAAHVDPEEITGRKVCLLANLEPRKIRGIKSQGMILMAENADGKLVLVAPEDGAEEGAGIQ